MRRVAMWPGLSVLAFWLGLTHHPAGAAGPKRPDRLEEALWWLPLDTQTLMVARGPWKIEIPKPGQQDSGLESPGLEEELRSLISGFSSERRAGASRVPPVAFALEGSRHFREPKDLGMMLYEGAQIVVFEQPLGPAADDLKRSLIERFGRPFFADDPVLQKETIAGHEVFSFEHQQNSDVVKTYLTLPRPDVLVCATDRRYLGVLLARMSKKGATRAFPADRPEWRHLDVSKPIWAIRHYDPKDAAEDPSSPLAGEERAANVPDDRAVGLVFSYDAGKSDVARVRYLSANKDALEIVRTAWTYAEEDIKPEVRQVGPGVVEMSLSLEGPMGRGSPASMFLLLLLQALGHAVYL
jgi:hypothetical protein